MKRFLFILFFITNAALAQKLPNTQQNNLRSPSEVIIDGKATEWSNQFEAYNKSTDLYYNLSNDDNTLYLSVQAKTPRIIEKIIAVGITFTLNKKGAKDYKDAENLVVTFPLLSVPDGSRVLSTSGIKTMNSSVEAALNAKSREMSTTRTSRSDSLIVQANKLLTNYANIIKIKGIPGVPDTLSIYNEHKIKTAAAFDNNGAYTYELALPLKRLGIALKGVNKFSYSIKLNSRLEDMKKGVVMVYRFNSNGDQIDPNQDLNSTTDFWADYILAKE